MLDVAQHVLGVDAEILVANGRLLHREGVEVDDRGRHGRLDQLVHAERVCDHALQEQVGDESSARDGVAGAKALGLREEQRQRVDHVVDLRGVRPDDHGAAAGVDVRSDALGQEDDAGGLRRQAEEKRRLEAEGGEPRAIQRLERIGEFDHVPAKGLQRSSDEVALQQLLELQHQVHQPPRYHRVQQEGPLEIAVSEDQHQRKLAVLARRLGGRFSRGAREGRLEVDDEHDDALAADAGVEMDLDVLRPVQSGRDGLLQQLAPLRGRRSWGDQRRIGAGERRSATRVQEGFVIILKV